MIGAVIDLGSNTFHILIAKLVPGNPEPVEVIARQSYFIGLSAGGGTTILQENFTKGLEALRTMRLILDKHSYDHIKVVGTSVLRTAANSPEFIKAASQILQTPVHVIDGDQEATYIAKGSLLHPALSKGNHVVMDIGGGSTEYIYLEDGFIKWKHSTPLGVGVLKQKFFKKGVVTNTSILQAKTEWERHTSFLETFHSNNYPDSLGGASGTFETMEIIMDGICPYGINTRVIPMNEFLKLYEDLVFSPLSKRKKYPNMPAKRVELIPVGLLLIQFTIEKIHPNYLQVTRFALKEGILQDFFA